MAEQRRKGALIDVALQRLGLRGVKGAEPTVKDAGAVPSGRKPRTQSFEGALEFKWLKLDHRFRTMIDIGANNGDFGNFLKSYFDLTRVIAFEPLPQYRSHLEQLGFEVHSVALADQDGSATFRVHANDAASSMLPMSELMQSNFPDTAETHSIEVPVCRLDVALSNIALEDDIIIKIDAQGMEDAIIRGGRDTFTRAKAVIIEMSFVPIYEGQALFNEVHALLADAGLRFTGIKSQVCTIAERRPLFAHCVYQR